MSDDLYAIENSTPSLSGILRIGFTTRTSEERLKEHNSNRNKEILHDDLIYFRNGGFLERIGEVFQIRKDSDELLTFLGVSEYDLHFL